MKRFFVYLYKALGFFGIVRKKKNKPLEPMGVRTLYPPGYISPKKRILSDGTVEYIVSQASLEQIGEALYKLKKETIKGCTI